MMVAVVCVYYTGVYMYIHSNIHTVAPGCGGLKWHLVSLFGWFNLWLILYFLFVLYFTSLKLCALFARFVVKEDIFFGKVVGWYVCHQVCWLVVRLFAATLSRIAPSPFRFGFPGSLLFPCHVFACLRTPRCIKDHAICNQFTFFQ